MKYVYEYDRKKERKKGIESTIGGIIKRTLDLFSKMWMAYLLGDTSWVDLSKTCDNLYHIHRRVPSCRHDLEFDRSRRLYSQYNAMNRYAQHKVKQHSYRNDSMATNTWDERNVHMADTESSLRGRHDDWHPHCQDNRYIEMMNDFE